MTRLGYYSGPIDGVYGDANIGWRERDAEGVGRERGRGLGPSTEAALKGKGKDVVVKIQTELATYGYYTGPIDGNYGTGTSAAVEQLQQDLGVTADGRVGAETVDAFNKAVADGTLQPSSTTPSSTTTQTTTTTIGTTTTGTTATTTNTAAITTTPTSTN